MINHDELKGAAKRVRNQNLHMELMTNVVIVKLGASISLF